MKIVVIQNFFNPYIIGGAELCVENLVNNLAKKGIETVLITAGKNKKIEMILSQANLKIYRFFPVNFYFNFPPKTKRNRLIKYLWWLVSLWNPFVYRSVKKILMTEKPDLVQIHNFYSLSPAVFSAARSLKIPIMYFPHDFFALCKNSIFQKKGNVCWNRCYICKLWSRWNMIFLRNIEFIFLSDFSKAISNKHFGMNGKVLRNAVNLSIQEIEENMILKEKKRRKSKTVNFLYMGRLSYCKGIMTLLEAFEKVKNKDVRLMIGGTGELIDKVKEKISEDSRMKYLGFISGRLKRETLLNSDVFILPSECYEVSPLTIQEAYGYGLPVIATCMGSMPEHIDLNDTGWTFPYKDTIALAKIIENLNIDIIKKSSKKTFQKAMQNTETNYIEKIICECEKIVKKNVSFS